MLIWSFQDMNKLEKKNLFPAQGFYVLTSVLTQYKTLLFFCTIEKAWCTKKRQNKSNILFKILDNAHQGTMHMKFTADKKSRTFSAWSNQSKFQWEIP